MNLLGKRNYWKKGFIIGLILSICLNLIYSSLFGIQYYFILKIGLYGLLIGLNYDLKNKKLLWFNIIAELGIILLVGLFFSKIISLMFNLELINSNCFDGYCEIVVAILSFFGSIFLFLILRTILNYIKFKNKRGES
jgi:hypothetical protein